MTTADDARAFLQENHRAVLITRRSSDDGLAPSPVAATVDGEGRVVVSSRETAVKTKNLLRDPRITLCVVTDGWWGPWIQVEGEAEIVRQPEALALLEDYYRSISGEHPDWDEYRQAMIDEKRVIIRFEIDRAGPTKSG